MRYSIDPKDDDKIGIYCIQNLINKKVYIGQTNEGFYKRWLRHVNMLSNHSHFNHHLQSAYDKYGSDNFEMTVIEVCSIEDDIAVLEHEYISFFQKTQSCYNILSGGPTMTGENNPFFGRSHSEESIRKMSAAKSGKCKGEANYFFGKDHSGENNGFYGHKHSEESKRKMSVAKSEMYKGTNNPFYGKTHTAEAKAKMANNGLHAQHKVVICLETGVKYRSISEAARQTNSNNKRISDVCRGVMESTNGLHWAYADNE